MWYYISIIQPSRADNKLNSPFNSQGILSHNVLARIVTSSLRKTWLLSQRRVLFTSDFLHPTSSLLQPQPQNSRHTSASPQSLKVFIDTLRTSTLVSSHQFAMSSTVLADRDINAAAAQQPANQKGDIKTLEYHRQVLQSKLDEEQYVNSLIQIASLSIGSNTYV